MFQAKFQSIAMIAMLASSICPTTSAQSHPAQPGYQVTIVAETRGRLTLQSELNSKLNETGDTITASLVDPIYAEGRLVLPKGPSSEARSRVSSKRNVSSEEATSLFRRPEHFRSGRWACPRCAVPTQPKFTRNKWRLVIEPHRPSLLEFSSLS